MTDQHPRLHEIAETHGRIVEVAILLGDRDRAHAAVDRAFATLVATRAVKSSQSIESVVNQRICGFLRAGGIHTIEDLCQQTRDHLAGIAGIRYRSVDIIERQLAKYGYSLRKVGGDAKDIEQNIFFDKKARLKNIKKAIKRERRGTRVRLDDSKIGQMLLF